MIYNVVVDGFEFQLKSPEFIIDLEIGNVFKYGEIEYEILEINRVLNSWEEFHVEIVCKKL
jgi:primase-polymerase (primpol)-like protein